MPLDERGREILDPTPVEVPLHLQRYIGEAERVRDMIRREISRYAEESGFESFAEADDFDVDDDFDPTSPYEEVFDPDTGVSMWDMPLKATDDPLSDQPGVASGKEGSQTPSPLEGDAKNQVNIPLESTGNQ